MSEPRILSPRLPYTTRARHRAQRCIDAAAYWLIQRGRNRAAMWLWRACRMW